MTEWRKKAIRQIVFGVVLLAVAVGVYWYNNRAPDVTSFAECAARGYPILESYPRQCKTADGAIFKEDIGNELEKDDLIRIAEPRPNAVVASPLTVKGMARGGWFFEASFPIRLLDEHGKEITLSHAQAQADPTTGEVNWMTTEFVPFEGTLTFTAPTSDTGTLILEKDNPSGLPEHADALRVPVKFR